MIESMATVDRLNFWRGGKIIFLLPDVSISPATRLRPAHNHPVFIVALHRYGPAYMCVRVGIVSSAGRPSIARLPVGTAFEVKIGDSHNGPIAGLIRRAKSVRRTEILAPTNYFRRPICFYCLDKTFVGLLIRRLDKVNDLKLQQIVPGIVTAGRFDDINVIRILKGRFDA
jgi:hypothetical protein